MTAPVPSVPPRSRSACRSSAVGGESEASTEELLGLVSTHSDVADVAPHPRGTGGGRGG